MKALSGMREALVRLVRPVWANPVVTRDLRVRMRGTKTMWAQAFYLFFLGLLAIAGYVTPVFGGRGTSIAVVQQHLLEFYMFIFVTTAALMCLIAPALTAASITTERQRLSLDLLVTAPLSATELLVGKLVSSVAFLVLLLVLALPVSSLCVILGGATLGDVFRTYALIAMSGLVMAAIGLYYSCAVRGSLPAVVWTYVTIAIFLFLTGVSMPISLFTHGPGRITPPSTSLSVLNPFVAVFFGAGSFSLGKWTVPLWAGAAVVAFFLIRLLVTAAAVRLGGHGGGALPSLRRQILFVTLTGALLVFSGPAPVAVFGRIYGDDVAKGVLILFAGAAVFLPGLFTPVVPEDHPPGAPLSGRYNLRAAFGREHGGTLPFFHLWLLALAVGSFGGVFLAKGRIDAKTTALMFLYLSAMGFFAWSVARRATSLVRNASLARSLAFATITVLCVIPPAMMVMVNVNVPLLQQRQAWIDMWETVWLMDPLAQSTIYSMQAALPPSTLLAYGLGVLICPFWKPLVPGSAWRRRRKPAAVPERAPVGRL